MGLMSPSSGPNSDVESVVDRAVRAGGRATIAAPETAGQRIRTIGHDRLGPGRSAAVVVRHRGWPTDRRDASWRRARRPFASPPGARPKEAEHGRRAASVTGIRRGRPMPAPPPVTMPGRLASGGAGRQARGLTRPWRAARIRSRSRRAEFRVRQAGANASRSCVWTARIVNAERGTARTHEEDVSAQEARAEARARLHGPNGHQGRSPRARSSSGQGAQAALRLTADRAFEPMPVLPMLRRRADFEAIGRRGTARSTPLLVLRSLRTDRTETRIGLSTPRTLGGAVQRNRVRRRLRELVRTRLERIGPGWDLLLIARPAAGQAAHDELGEAIDALLARSGIGR